MYWFRFFYKNIGDSRFAKSVLNEEKKFSNFTEAFNFANNYARNNNYRLVMIAELSKT